MHRRGLRCWLRLRVHLACETSPEFARSANLVDHVLSVSKTETLRREAEYEKQAALNPERRVPIHRGLIATSGNRAPVRPGVAAGSIGRRGIIACPEDHRLRCPAHDFRPVFHMHLLTPRL